eukprot:scaffold227150_cov26-Attheya_sp.AAC.1
MDLGYVGIVDQPTGQIRMLRTPTRVRNVPHEASKSKKCDDKATKMVHTPELFQLQMRKIN